MEYKTADLNLSAFLKAKYNLKILRLEPNPVKPERFFFVFGIDNNINIEQYVSNYYNEEDLCSINSFMREINDLRTWLKDHKINKKNYQSVIMNREMK